MKQLELNMLSRARVTPWLLLLGFLLFGPSCRVSAQCVQIENASYYPSNPQPSSFDYNTVGIGVAGRARYICTREQFDNRSFLTIGCYMNTEAASAEKPGKDWRNTAVSCTSNEGPNQSPDYPTGCPHVPALHLIEVWEETGDLGALVLNCDQHSLLNPIHRCFNGTQPNGYVGGR